MRLDLWPLLFLPRVGKKVLHDGAALSRLFQTEERFAWHPAVLLGQVPAPPLVAQAHDHGDAVILHVERLAAPLDTITKHGYGFLAKNVPYTLWRKIGPLNHSFRAVSDLNLTHSCLSSVVTG